MPFSCQLYSREYIKTESFKYSQYRERYTGICPLKEGGISVYQKRGSKARFDLVTLGRQRLYAVMA